MMLVAVLGLVIAVFVAAFEPSPGYMDADYYYAGGQQLATGHGFTEPYLWNYLDNPVGIPHPSNAYWMPLAALLAAAGDWLFGASSWLAARVPFMVVAAAIPPLTSALAWRLTSRRDLSLTSGLLAVFPAFYLPYLPVTDTFGLYMLLGGCFLLVLSDFKTSNSKFSIFILPFLLGVISGLMHLTRADGLLWLFLAVIATFIFCKAAEWPFSKLYSLLAVLLGYLLIMAPWFARNISVFGAALAPGGSKMLWLTSYDQLFAFPSSQLSLATLLHSGLGSILNVRLWSLGLNLASALTVQAEILLVPFIGLGLWYLRKDRRVQLAALAWLLTLAVMTVTFPFAGARGGFFHSGAALQTMWWALAPLGLDRIVDWVGRKRDWNILRAGSIFRMALVGMVVMLTAVLIWTRVIGGDGSQAWGGEDISYRQVNEFLVAQGEIKSDVVMIANPPGFYLASGNPAIAIPDGGFNTLLTVARKYHASYLVLEAGSTPARLLPVYEGPQDQTGLTYLGEINNARIFRLP